MFQTSNYLCNSTLNDVLTPNIANFSQVGVPAKSPPSAQHWGGPCGAACAGRGPRLNLFKLNLLIMTHIQRLRTHVCVALTPESYTKFSTSSFIRPAFYCGVFSYMGHSFVHSNRQMSHDSLSLLRVFRRF